MNSGTATAAICRPLTPARFQEPPGSSVRNENHSYCGASMAGLCRVLVKTGPRRRPATPMPAAMEAIACQRALLSMRSKERER